MRNGRTAFFIGLWLTRISQQISSQGSADGHGYKAHLALWPARRKDSAGVLDSTSRNPTKRNAVDMPGYAAAVESLWVMRASETERLAGAEDQFLLVSAVPRSVFAVPHSAA